MYGSELAADQVAKWLTAAIGAPRTRIGVNLMSTVVLNTSDGTATRAGQREAGAAERLAARAAGCMAGKVG
jgi:hypothetical protein